MAITQAPENQAEGSNCHITLPFCAQSSNPGCPVLQDGSFLDVLLDHTAHILPVSGRTISLAIYSALLLKRLSAHLIEQEKSMGIFVSCGMCKCGSCKWRV